MGRPRTWTDDQLREAFAAHSIPPAICRVLGLTNTAKNRRLIRKRLGELGLTADDWDRKDEKGEVG